MLPFGKTLLKLQRKRITASPLGVVVISIWIEIDFQIIEKGRKRNMRDGRLILKLLKRDEKKSASEYNAPAREPIQVEAQMKKVKASEESGTFFRRKDIRCQSTHFKRDVDISNIQKSEFKVTSFSLINKIPPILVFFLMYSPSILLIIVNNGK